MEGRQNEAPEHELRGFSRRFGPQSGGGKAVASSLGSRLCARLQMTNALPPHWLPLILAGRTEPPRPSGTFHAGRP